MKTSENKSAKRRYDTPEIVCVDLDNEIALALASPAEGPGEGPGDEAFLKSESVMNDSFLTLS